MSEGLFLLVGAPAHSSAALEQWLVQMAQPKMNLLLAYCDDGFVWGRVEQGKVVQASDCFNETPARLEADALQQARLFGAAGELLVWRVPGGLAARLIWHAAKLPLALQEKVQTNAPVRSLDDALADERYLLWGDHVVRSHTASFVLLAEGRQGLRHAPPLPGLAVEERGALLVRHYVEYDDEGRAAITMSRLVGLTTYKNERRGA